MTTPKGKGSRYACFHASPTCVNLLACERRAVDEMRAQGPVSGAQLAAELEAIREREQTRHVLGNARGGATKAANAAAKREEKANG